MMCHVCFSQYLHDREEMPIHRGAAIARSLGVAVDPEPSDRLTAGNILTPLTFADGEIDCFIRDNACSIHRLHLVKFPAAGRLWTANCPTCGPVMQHNWVRKSQLERVESDEAAARIELRDKQEINTSDTIKELYGG